MSSAVAVAPPNKRIAHTATKQRLVIRLFMMRQALRHSTASTHSPCTRHRARQCWPLSIRLASLAHDARAIAPGQFARTWRATASAGPLATPSPKHTRPHTTQKMRWWRSFWHLGRRPSRRCVARPLRPEAAPAARRAPQQQWPRQRRQWQRLRRNAVQRLQWQRLRCQRAHERRGSCTMPAATRSKIASRSPACGKAREGEGR